MKVIELDGARIGLDIIPEGEGNRRERERAAVASILEKLTGRHVEICHEPSGAPYPADRSFYLSISHSRHIAAVLAGSSPGWGIDIEEPRPGQLERVASRVLCDGERERCGSLLQVWTLKEAAFKAAALPIADLREIHLAGNCRILARDIAINIVASLEINDFANYPAWLSVVKKEGICIIPTCRFPYGLISSG